MVSRTTVNGLKIAHPRLFRRFSARLCVLFALLLPPFLAPSFAEGSSAVDAGLGWLADRVQPDGSYSSDGDIGTRSQVTAEAVRAFLTIDEASSPDTALTLQTLHAEVSTGTEELARLIGLQSQAGQAAGRLLPDLLGNRNPDGGFGSGAGYRSTALDTAYALEALHSVGEIASPAAASAVAYLRASQTAEGAWRDSGARPSLLVTALVMRSLWYGRNHYAIAGALDPAQAWLLAEWGRGNGPEHFETALSLLAVLPRLSDTGPVAAALGALREGQSTDGSWGGDIFSTALAVRALAHAARPVLDPDLGTLRGRVLEGDTGLPLADVQVVLDGLIAATQTTDSGGEFRFQGLPAGDYGLALGLADYGVVTTATRLGPGADLDLGQLALIKGQDSQTAILRGLVTDAISGQPLADVSIVTDGGAFAVTAADGSYQIAGLTPGQVGVGASLGGYVGAAAEADVSAGSVFVFSPALAMEGSGTPGEGPASLAGVVLDSITNEPLAGVLVTASFDGGTDTQATDGDGRFLIQDIGETPVDLSFVLADYRASAFSVAVEPDRDQDIGQIRLRREEVENLMPDLVAVELDTSAISTDPHTLSLSGSLDVVLENRGTASVAREFSVLAFFDVDGNGQFDLDGDRVLGRAEMPGGVAIGKTTPGHVPLNGQLPFRGAPVSVWVDDAQVVAESKEANNRIDTAGLCRIEPPPVEQLDPVVKWHWNLDNVDGTPVVAPLIDTNSDGLTDESDVPAVLFVSYSDNQDVGTIRAVRGDTGEEIWSLTDPDDSAYRNRMLTVGDIDADGFIEILATRADLTGLRVYEHTGAFKWQADIPGGWWPTIADLDGDGSVEILYEQHVLSSTGETLWKWDGPGQWFPMVADIDLDGTPEVVTGDAAYSADGRLLWHAEMIEMGDILFAAIASFDADDLAEIVVVTGGQLWLLEHDGTPLWGPVALPGGGRGGSPTIGDFDADGVPEIGVAGAHNYVAFDTDGSILWSSPIQDGSSHMTGSSVFDFDADGAVEVVYGDELYFRVYDGATGAVRYWISNTSHTAYEMPVVADVDGDGHAEILVVANGAVRGLRAFESSGDNWAPTRKIWNQHSYHITNINDDGSIPRYEEPSWLSHNTYRLNTFVDRNPLDATDLSAARLTLIDNGTDQPKSLGVRVGNGGGVALAEPARIAFYQGDPDTGGVPLGELEVMDLPAAGFRDLVLDGVALAGTEDIHVLIDPADAVEECVETNNRTSIPYDRTTARGTVRLEIDASSYGPASPVQAQATVTNTGSFPNDYRVELHVEDAAGNPVAALPQPPPASLVAGGAETVPSSWDTGSYVVGDYRLRVLLYGDAGTLLDEADADFAIAADAEPPASLVVATDRPGYHTGDRVEITTIARNLTANRVLAAARVALVVQGPDDEILQVGELSAVELTPGALHQGLYPQGLTGASEGVYEIRARLLDSDGEVLAVAQSEFLVSEDLGLTLSGAVEVGWPEVQTGEQQLCTETLSFGGGRTLSAQPVRHLTIRLENGEEFPLFEESEQIALAGEGSRVWVRDLPTLDLVPDDYACVLQAEIDGNWTTLDFASFEVAAPPVDIGATMELGEGARLLVLVDKPARCRGHGHRGGNDDENNDRNRCNEDRDDDGDAEDGGDDEEDAACDHDSRTAAQRAFLESLLISAGWSYSLVDDPDAFARELRSGGYGLCLLQSTHNALSKQIQQELVEAVYNGAGLVIAGDGIRRNGFLGEATGVKSEGRFVHNWGVAPSGMGPFATRLLDIGRRLRAHRLESAGALELGYYKNLRGVSTDKAAVTGNAFGDGYSFSFGFDLLAEATRSGDRDGPFAQLLLAALAEAEPYAPTLAPAAVLPVVIGLENRGIAIDGRVLLNLPEYVSVIDPGDAVQDPLRTLVWPFSLDGGEHIAFDAWMRLPDAEQSLAFDALVQTGQDPYFEDYRRLRFYSTPLRKPPGIEAARLAMEADAAFKKPLRYLENAVRWLDRGDPEKALERLVKCAGALRTMDSPTAAQIRHWVGNGIAEVSRLTLPPPRPWQLDAALAVMAEDEVLRRPRIYLQKASRVFDSGDLEKALAYLEKCADRLEELDDARVPQLRQWLDEIAASLVEYEKD